MGAMPFGRGGAEDIDLVSAYEAAASLHGAATLAGDYKAANKAHDQLAATYRELRSRGRGAQQLLLPLLESPDAGVRGWAAAHALEFAAERGVPVLETLAAAAPPLLSFSAEMMLKQWRAGRLRFP